MSNSVKSLYLKFGGKKIKDREYQFKTTIGTLIVVDFKDDTFIPMRFEKDFNREEFVKRSHDNSVGEHSYKWNLHSSDKEYNLQRLEQRLTFMKNNYEL